MPFPPEVDPALWDVVEITDPDEAAAAGYPGENGHLKATFGEMPTAEGYTLRHALLGAAPNTGQPPVVSNSTFVTTVQQQVGASISPKLYWRQTSDNAMQLAGQKGPIVIQGLDSGTVDPPVLVSPLPDVLYRQGSGPQTVDVASAFSGADQYGLVAPPAGVTISGSVVSIPTSAEGTGAVTVRATNAGGSVDDTFLARVMAAPSVSAPIPNQTWQENSGQKTVQCAPAFSGQELTFSITAGPGAIDQSTGVATFSTANPLTATVTVRATNPVGFANDSFDIVVQAQGGGANYNADTLAELSNFMSQANPGQVIELAGGTYTGGFNKSNVSKAEPRVTMRAPAQANRPILRCGPNQMIDWNNVDGFIVDGFQFEQTETDQGSPWGGLVGHGNCSRLTYRNCTFKGARFQFRPQGDIQGLTLEFCELRECGQGFFESFGGGSDVTLRNTLIHEGRLHPRFHEPGFHPDGIQFGRQGNSSVWNRVTIENCRQNYTDEGFNCIFIGQSSSLDGNGFNNFVIRRNWFTSHGLNTIRLANMKNVLVEDCRITNANSNSKAELRIEGNHPTTGAIRNTVIPRQITGNGNDQTQKTGLVISQTATPQGWSGFDVANGRYGPYKQ